MAKITPKTKPAKDSKGLIKNPKTPVSERPKDYAGVGAPSKYRPEFCEKIIELGKEGKSRTQMASHFDVSRETIAEWARVHTEFSAALIRADAHCQAWWENMGQQGLMMPKEMGTFNAAVWSKSVSSRFPDHYTEKKQVEMSGRVSLLEALRAADSE